MKTYLRGVIEQPMHPHSLIGTVVVRLQNHLIMKNKMMYSKCFIILYPLLTVLDLTFSHIPRRHLISWWRGQKKKKEKKKKKKKKKTKKTLLALGHPKAPLCSIISVFIAMELFACFFLLNCLMESYLLFLLLLFLCASILQMCS